jgi:thioredoxin-dependent peroxiredoxin
MLCVGDPAPEFLLKDQHDVMHTLKDSRGSWVLIYFYPKDNTPGCTKEACSIRDNFSAFKKQGIVVFGVSIDSVKSHGKFAEMYELPFTLLADTEKEMVTEYGVWGKKKFMGREYMGVNRWSFLVDPNGKIVKIYESVRPEQHATEILEDVKKMTK